MKLCNMVARFAPGAVPGAPEEESPIVLLVESRQGGG